MVETKPKAAPKKEAPKKAAPTKEAPKKEAPKKAAPKKDAPKKAAPKKDAPKKVAPKKEASKKVAPKKEGSKKLTPKKVVVKKEAPKKAVKEVKKLSAKKEARLAKKVALKAEKLKRADPLKRIKFKAIQKQKLAVGSVRFGRKKRAIIKKIAKPHLKKMDPANKKHIVYTTRTVKNKKGETRVIKFKKPPNYYPTEDKRRNRPAQKKVRPNYLKDSLKPGTVAILVAGEHKGKRVVFLKQLQSGLCLVTGPYGLNRCPLRRVNQIYMIGTSTRIRLPTSFKVPKHINDEYFRKVRINNKKSKKEEGDIFNIKPKKYVVNQVKRHEQRNVDMVILKAIRARKDRKQLCAYMTNKFSLTSNQFPHELKF